MARWWLFIGNLGCSRATFEIGGDKIFFGDKRDAVWDGYLQHNEEDVVKSDDVLAAQHCVDVGLPCDVNWQILDYCVLESAQSVFLTEEFSLAEETHCEDCKEARRITDHFMHVHRDSHRMIFEKAVECHEKITLVHQANFDKWVKNKYGHTESTRQVSTIRPRTCYANFNKVG